ncbi:MAG TPA: succinyl-diaminopimelate desuccinylase, partial [Alphaproteobacteria bacterium]|nr:succinyl-diaminopimelate desuccinylase [Alphaproteobacteria bacterium]
GAFAAAVSSFLNRNGPPKGSISFLITGDEEGPAVDGTRRVLEWMAQKGHIPDACLVGEPSNPDTLGQEVKIGRRGSLSGTLVVTGKQGHVAYPHLADNPIPRLVRLLDGLGIAVLDQGSAHFQPSNIEITCVQAGGIAGNVIPARAQASFNVRFNDRWTEKTLSARLREILDRVGVAYDLSLRCDAHAFLSGAGPFARLVVRAAAEVTGLTPVFSTRGGSSDARFIQAFCPVAEFGLTNATAHHANECARIDDIRNLARIYERFLELYFEAGDEHKTRASAQTRSMKTEAALT